MKIIIAAVAVFSLCVCCVSEIAASSTNSCVKVVQTVIVTNTPLQTVSHSQCEAITKSGNRCKRKAVPGGNLCRQHKKIAEAVVSR